MALDLSAYPRFSLAERDRRWGRVRELMREHNVACLVAPGDRDLESQATSRYLSQIGGVGVHAWVVFPQDGEVTAVVESARNRDLVTKAWNWISDPRVGEPSELIPERLRELGLDGSRVGLTQYAGHYRREEGIIAAETLRKLQEALPKTQFYGENEILKQARVIKSPEEIAVIERVAAANEEAIRVMCETSRPGRRQDEVWYAMNDVLTRASAGWPARLSVTYGGSGNSTLGMPIPDVIAAGSLCSQEICARVQGYRAQCNHTIQVGEGGPADYEDVMRKTIEVFNEILAWIGPGRTVQQVMERYVELCKARGAQDRSGVVMHTNGLGDDYPRLGPRLAAGDELTLVLQPG
ncbi:MAG: Xaa-Pro dipeptidase, partial [Chloroflexota bacterium]|nr:Xaa-Pro dipeptidase [Chloroflexota bacterium]